MFGHEYSLMEMTDGYKVWALMETHSGSLEDTDGANPTFPELGPTPTGSKLGSPYTVPHPIDLTTTSDHTCVETFGEKTPMSHSEAPEYVLALIKDEGRPAKRDKPSASAVKVCLEKRFNTLSPETVKRQDFQSAVLSNLLSKLQKSVKAHREGTHPEKPKFVTTDQAKVFEVSNVCVDGVFNPVPGVCGQPQIPTYVVGPKKQQGLLYPSSLNYSFYPERVLAQALNPSGSDTGADIAVTPASIRRDSNTHLSEVINGTKAGQRSEGASQQDVGRKKPRTSLSVGQRRERHNRKERERRRNIRLCCDKLNTLVPFCESDTDKVTTLQWTAAFLEYIKEIYGDIFKEEFKAFACKKNLWHTSSSTADENPTKEQLDNKLRAEQ